MKTKAAPKTNEIKLTHTQEILNPYFSERNTPIIGPQKSSILIAKFCIADAISFANSWFSVKQFSLRILLTSIITGTLTEVPDTPMKDNSKTSEPNFCGNKLKGITKRTPKKLLLNHSMCHL